MPHDCIDWTTRPPTRKTSVLILRCGDDHVYIAVPKDFKTLQNIARKEFDLGNVDVKISSSCLNLCNGALARITESAWEHLGPSIGCATVEVVRPRGRAPQEQPLAPRAENAANECDLSAKGELPLNTDEAGGGPSASAKDAARHGQDPPSDHDDDRDRAATPEKPHEESWEVDGAVSPRKPRPQRRVVSEDEDEADGFDRDRRIPANSRVPVVASPAKQAMHEIKKERLGDYRSEPESQQTEQPPSYSDTLISHSPSKRSVKGVTNHSQPQSQPFHKLTIRVAHRSTKLEFKFTTKSTTKVSKVLTGACKSFGFDASRASLWLIVSTEGEDGEDENLFPCDKNDSIARAGAELDVESKFLLKIEGEE